MFDQCKDVCLLFGRFLLSAIFLLSGTMKIFNWQQTAAAMASEGMMGVEFFLFMSILVEIGAGLGVLLGCGTRLSALTLVLFLVPVTLVFHHFWTYEGQAMQNQMQHFLKNLTIMGGLIALMGAGAGRFSVDAQAVRMETREHAHEPLEAVMR